ncbi:hypothetical protein [Ruminococcus flavefaciens]|uniref:Uncharacterized protein n=1 Tax=Ruminococcus flavefaciens TaxID=1265 RepID=A0A1M7LEU9_RUMFL|nr:hypothetical protein [Ruminococcus flavefaciens]SHM76655.1 hypothetical protein SAMN04487860_11331 [Ruminococcus flavefaciens]
MTKKSDNIKWVCFGGIGVYLMRCITIAAEDGLHAPLWDYLGLGYASAFGAVLMLSLLGLIGLAVSKRIGKRKATGLKPISMGYKISFILSYIPYVLLLAYCLYCSKYGFDFFTTTYGWEGFYNAFLVMGAVFCIVPVLPFCLFWQILFIVKWVRNRKVKQENHI